MEVTASGRQKRPMSILPPGTVHYEDQFDKDDLEYQSLWSSVMDEGKYTKASPYTTVEVLILCWEETCNDLAVRDEVSQLRATLEVCFNYHTQVSYLDTSLKKSLQVQANSIVANFMVLYDSPSTLLLLYYAGHARPGSYYGSLLLHGKTPDTDRKVDVLDWNKTEKFLGDAEGDVLEIFDCCYAGNLCLTRMGSGSARRFEYLAATRELGLTHIPGQSSFTSALIFALKALLKERGRFTTVELLAKIKGDTPDFPHDQCPVLADRSSNSLAGHIILYPLHKNQTDGSQSVALAEEDTILDAYKSRVLTVHFDFASKPSCTAIELIGRQLNQVITGYNLDVNQVRWGGLRESATARAVKAFSDSQKRSRYLSIIQRQATSDSTDPQPIRISPSKSFPIKGSKSSTRPETSYPRSSTSSIELSTTSGEISSATSLSMVNQWKEFDQPKLEQHEEEQMAVRDILIERIADTSILGNTLKTRFINVAYRCSWELLRVLQDEYEPNQPLSGIITLTGTLECAQAATCGEYISQTWPNAGSFLLQAIEDTLKVTQETPLEYDLPPCKPAQGSVAGFEEIQLCIEKAPLAAGKTIRPIILRVKGSMSFQVEVAEILTWLTAAIRVSESTELRLSRARLLFTQYYRDTDQFSFGIEPGTLENPQRNADLCWQPLFVNSVIAVQFPVRERFQGVGVDITPMLMATLAGTVTAVQFRGGLILKGLSNALIPVRRLRGEQAIQWHLEVTDSTEGIIQTGLKPTTTDGDEFEIYRVDNVETFWENRAYLGWCSVIAILLGTKKINYSRVTWSDPFRHQMTVNINSFSIGIASAGAGFGGPSVSANFAIGKRNRPVFMNVEQALEDRLKFSILKPLLSYDTLSKRAWMVPTTCMLLHMMHLRVRLLAKCVGDSEQESIGEVPFASISQDGGSEAYGILVKYLRTEEVSPLGSSKTWKETLAKFYVGLDMALNESIIAKEKASFASSHELCGFELMDIVRAESPFKFTQRQIRRESGGWTTVAESLGYALFCSGLGDAMVPGEGANDLCRSWQHVPHNSDYLCAYVPCIAEILTHQGKHIGHQRLMANEFQQSHYKSCSHEENSRCSSHLRTFEEVADPRVIESRSGLFLTDANASGSIIPSGGNRGAFIIGKITKVTKAFPRDGPSDGGAERVPRFGGFWSGTKRKRNRSA